MYWLDSILTAVGIFYGILLVLAAFVRNKVTEAFRIDALFTSQPPEATRKINLVAGILIIGYNIYVML